MSKSYLAALAATVALAFSAMPTSLTAAEAGRATVSPASAKALKAVQDAITAKQWSEAVTLANKALTVPEKTPFDTLTAYRFLAYAHQQQGNKAELLRALQGQLDSGALSPAEQTQALKNMYGTAFEAKDYAQAQELGQRLIRSGAAGSEAYDQVAIAMVQQGKKAEAAKFLGDYVADVEKRGQKPSEATLTRLRALQEELGHSDAASQTVEKLVVHYPKPDYWALLTYGLARDPKLNDRQRMHVFRLRVATGTLKLCRDYTEMADFAVNSGMAGEGQKVIDQGLAAKACKEKVEQDRLLRLQNSAAREAGEEKARLAKLEADARVAKTGEPDVAVGASQFGFGEFGKSAEWLSRGVAKGGLKYPADAQLTLGIAQLRAGNKAEALKTFRAIKSEDPITQRIVKLWTLYAQ
jgi:tetratricopeptide (TPR) repeat protein